MYSQQYSKLLLVSRTGHDDVIEQVPTSYSDGHCTSTQQCQCVDNIIDSYLFKYMYYHIVSYCLDLCRLKMNKLKLITWGFKFPSVFIYAHIVNMSIGVLVKE